MTEPYDSQWWDDRMDPTASDPPQTSTMWRRWRLVDEILQRYYMDFGVAPVFGWTGVELYQVGLASPSCQRAPRYFGRLCDTGLHDADQDDARMLNEHLDGVTLDPYRAHTTEFLHDLSRPWNLFLVDALAHLGLPDAGVVGHERCFHRRGRDLTPLMFRAALLLRVGDSRAISSRNALWTLPSRSDSLANGSEGMGGVEVRRLLQRHGEAAPPGAPRWTAVKHDDRWTLLRNDGHILGATGTVDGARMWRSGASVADIAHAAAQVS